MITTPEAPVVPAGFMMDAQGRMVPEANVKEQDKLRDQVAKRLALRAKQLNEDLRQFRMQALEDIADLVKIAAERYDVQIGGDKGNVTITTFDGQYKVVRSIADRIQFGEELEPAKVLINQCIERWSEGANSNIRVLVDRAFRADRNGKIKTTAILELLRLDIQDDEWQRAMEAIKDSIQTTGTAVYVRVYERDSRTDKYDPVPLDLANV